MIDIFDGYRRVKALKNPTKRYFEQQVEKAGLFEQPNFEIANSQLTGS